MGHDGGNGGIGNGNGETEMEETGESEMETERRLGGIWVDRVNWRQPSIFTANPSRASTATAYARFSAQNTLKQARRERNTAVLTDDTPKALALQY